MVTSKDGTRRPTTITFSDAVRTSDAYLLVDVFATDLFGHITSNSFTPLFVINAILRLPNPIGANKLVWVGRKFYGDCDVVCSEGAWIRSNGKITFRSSLVEPIDYQHDPCDWLWQTPMVKMEVDGVARTLTWNVVRSVGGVYVLSFNLMEGLEYAGADRDMFDYETNLLRFRSPSSNPIAHYVSPWLSYLPSLGSKLVLLH